MWTIKENTSGLEEDLSKFLKENKEDDSARDYLLIYNKCGKHTAIKTIAKNVYDALVNTYLFLGKKNTLTANEMKLLFTKSDLERACEIFNNFSGVELIWLSEIKDPLIDKIDIIEQFHGIKIDCSTCKNNVEYLPPHTCDICTSLDQEMYCMWESKNK